MYNYNVMGRLNVIYILFRGILCKIITRFC